VTEFHNPPQRDLDVLARDAGEDGFRLIVETIPVSLGQS
jgi:hypothetical protein